MEKNCTTEKDCAMENTLPGSFNRCSAPSQLKITDVRFTDIVGAPMHCTLMKIYTNQGIVGLGEVRDGGSRVYGEMLKSRILGENPCNVEKLFRRIKQFGGAAHTNAVSVLYRGLIFELFEFPYKMEFAHMAHICVFLYRVMNVRSVFYLLQCRGQLDKKLVDVGVYARSRKGGKQMAEKPHKA